MTRSSLGSGASTVPNSFSASTSIFGPASLDSHAYCAGSAVIFLDSPCITQGQNFLDGLNNQCLALQHGCGAAALPLARCSFVRSKRPIAHSKLVPLHHRIFEVRTSSISTFLIKSLLERAVERDYPRRKPVDIDYVSQNGDLYIVDETFDLLRAVTASSTSPILSTTCSKLVGFYENGGRYLLVVSDKCYCFDHFFSESSLDAVLLAHAERRTRHSLESLIAHQFLVTHNDTSRHWNGDHGSQALVEQSAIDRLNLSTNPVNTLTFMLGSSRRNVSRKYSLRCTAKDCHL